MGIPLTSFPIYGQSNPVGGGDVVDLKKYGNYDRHAGQVWCLDVWDRWRLAKDPLHEAGGRYPVMKRARDAGVSCGISFANTVLDKKPRLRVGLIPCAVGGKTLDFFMPGGAAYAALLARTRRADRNGSIGGMIFGQGESDTASADLVTAWPDKFRLLIDTFRADIGANIPVFMAGIGDKRGKFNVEPRRSEWSRLHDLQMSINHPGVYPVSARGIPLNDDAHWSTDGQVTMGRRFAYQYLASLTKSEAA